MRRVLPLAILLGIALTACANEAEVDVTGLDVSEVRERAVEAMAELESYRVNLTIGGFQMTVDYEKPNQYRTIVRVSESVNTDENAPDTFEFVYLGDRIFDRECADVDEGCEPWEERPRGDIVLGGSLPNYPQWPPVALEMAGDLSLAADGAELVVRGSVNLLRAVLESLRRAIETAGITAFGRSCTSVSVLIVDGTPQQRVEPEPTEFCRDTTFEELLEREADDLAAGDANPATFEALIDPDTYLLLDFESSILSQDDGDEGVRIRFEYSHFNGVTIELPEEFQ